MTQVSRRRPGSIRAAPAVSDDGPSALRPAIPGALNGSWPSSGWRKRQAANSNPRSGWACRSPALPSL